MKKRIEKIDEHLKVLWYIHGHQKHAVYLSNKQAITFMPYLEEGYVIDFTVTDKTKIIAGYKAQQLHELNTITDPMRKKEIFNINLLKKELFHVLMDHDYYLFIDFEMTMPEYAHKGFFRSEIIQVGYVLTDRDNTIIKEDSFYVYPKLMLTINRRTQKFLQVEEAMFTETAHPYLYLYQTIKEIVQQYHPKWVVWGKNDKIILQDSYQLHQVKPLTDEDDYIDLLKVHKDYFSVKDDIGLFKAYKIYYEEDLRQMHDAIDDAKVTHLVFQAFMAYVQEDLKENIIR